MRTGLRIAIQMTLSLTAVLVPPSRADTIDVPADYPTVLQALDAAVAGDVVELAPGEYTDFETRSGRTSVGFLKAGVTLHSSGGAANTTLRLPSAPIGSTPATLSFDASNGGVVLRGLTLTGEAAGMWAFIADHSDVGPTSVTMEDCVVEDFEGEGLRIVDWGAEGGSITIRRCTFRNIDGSIGYSNIEAVLVEDSAFSDCTIGWGAPARFFTARNCGFARLGWAAFVTDYPAENGLLENCRFVDSEPAYVYGDVGSTIRVTACTFIRARLNVTTLGAVEIAGNTLYGGEVTAPVLEVLNDDAPASSAAIHHNIFAYGWAGYPAVLMRHAQLSCNDFWSNLGGDVVAGSPGITDFSADPLFCDRVADDLHVHAESPCLAVNNPACGDVGSLGVGCSPVSVRPLGWGQLKTLYR